MENLKNKIKTKYVALTTLGTGALIAGQSAFAQSTPPSFEGITSAVDFSTVATGVVSVAGLVAVVYISISGAKKLLSMIRSA